MAQKSYDERLADIRKKREQLIAQERAMKKRHTAEERKKRTRRLIATKKTAEVVDYVEKTPNAIGIIGSNWLNDKRDTTNLTWKKNIRVLAISRSDDATPANSYKPYQGYIYNDFYPFIRRIYALLNDERGKYGLPWGFAQFVAAPKGQMIIFKAGLLPAYGNISVRDVKISD